MPALKHSPVGASGAYRFINCPASVGLSDGLPDYTEYVAAEGTVAHTVCELLWSGVEPKELLNTVYESSGHKVKIDEDMIEHCQDYVTLIKELAGDEGIVHIEVQVNLHHLHPDLWGTADCVIWIPSERRLIILDFKYGIIEVEPDSPQLRYYALGSVRVMGYDPLIIETIIHQPRSVQDRYVKRAEHTPQSLQEFSDLLVRTMERVEDPFEDPNPGDWCGKNFCRARSTCPALFSLAKLAAREEFDMLDNNATPMEFLTDEELLERRQMVSAVVAWSKHVIEVTERRFNANGGMIGMKSVEGRRTRQWLEPDKDKAADLISILTGIEPEELFDTKVKVLSPNKLEKVLRRHGLKIDSVDAMIVRSNPRVMVVLETDHRDAIVRPSIEEDFDILD